LRGKATWEGNLLGLFKIGEVPKKMEFRLKEYREEKANKNKEKEHPCV